MTGQIYWFICTQQAADVSVPTVAAAQTDFNRRTANAVAGLRKSRRNVGDLLARPNSNSVTGHLLCDGSAVGRVNFPQLFKEIGEDWGAGDGTTTFNIPNLVGTALPTAPTAPVQTVSENTVSTGAPVVTPADPGQTGGSSGGNVYSGGRPRKELDGYYEP